MNGFVALGILLGLVAVATAAGLGWRGTAGRVRSVRGDEHVTAADVATDALGRRATLLQFSTEFCAPCRSTARVLGGLADDLSGVRHVEVDLTRRPDLADRFHILQTPTTLVLDGTGAVRARIGGAVRADDVRTVLHRILGSPHVAA